MQESRVEESLLLLPSVETRTVVSALKGMSPELKIVYYSWMSKLWQNSFMFVRRVSRGQSQSQELKGSI